MKKVVKGFVLCLVLSAVVYYGYTSYKKAYSYLGVVHENADSILKVGVHDIKETIAWDAIRSPKYYYNNSFSKDDSDDDANEKRDQGATLPYNVIIYTLPTIEDTYFTSIEIYDSTDFEVFIKEELDKKAIVVEEADDKSYRFAKLKGIKTYLGWSDKRVVVAASLNPSFEKVKQVFLDVLIHDKTIKNADHKLIKVLKNQSSHATYVKGDNISNLDFKDGQVYFKGNITTDKPSAFSKELSVEINTEASLSLYFDSNYKQNFLKDKFLKKIGKSSFFAKNNIDANQFIKRTDGFFSIEIDGTTTQQDTIITYDYDDNFEKVEKKTLQEKQVPKIAIKLGAENESLMQYLSAIGTIDNSAIFTSFPFYQLQVEEDAMHTYFCTFSTRLKRQKEISTNFFEAKIDFKKLQKDLEIPQTRKLFSLLEYLNINAYRDNQEKISIEGTLCGKNAEVNILSQLFFGMATANTSPKEETEL